MPSKKIQRHHDSSIVRSTIHAFMALACLDPSSSSEESNSPNKTPNRRGIFTGMPATAYFPSEPLSAKAEYILSEEEYAERQATENAFNKERIQIEALFCVSSDKTNMADVALMDGMQLAARQLCFLTIMQEAETCANNAIALAALQAEEARARAEITAEFTAAEPERTDIKNMFNDGLVIEKLGDDFQPVSPTASQSRLFQPVAASTPATKSWTDWLFR